jgi:hypothetical protein
MLAVPTDNPVTTPDELTVATPGVLDVHVPPEGIPVSVEEYPVHSLQVPPM